MPDGCLAPSLALKMNYLLWIEDMAVLNKAKNISGSVSVNYWCLHSGHILSVGANKFIIWSICGLLIMILYLRIMAKNIRAYVASKEMACLSNEHLYFDALWVKVMRTLISPDLVGTSYNVAVSLCCVFEKRNKSELSRISSFKRSCKLLTGV